MAKINYTPGTYEQLLASQQTGNPETGQNLWSGPGFDYRDYLTPQGTLDFNDPLIRDYFNYWGAPKNNSSGGFRNLGILDPGEMVRLAKGSQFDLNELYQTGAKTAAISDRPQPGDFDSLVEFVTFAAPFFAAPFAAGALGAPGALAGAETAGAGTLAELGLGGADTFFTAAGAPGALAGAGGGMDLTGFMNPSANPSNLFDAGPNWWDANAPDLGANPLNVITSPPTGVSAIDYPGQVVNLAEGGMTSPASFWDTLSQYGPNAVPAVKKLLDSGGSKSDLMSLLGRIAPALLGAFASSQQSKSLTELADKYFSVGAPSRARYESSFRPGFTMANEPGYSDALNQTTKSFLHKASIAGNPADSPNAWMQTLKDVNATFAYPALQEYRRQAAGAGGLASLTAAAPAAAQAAVGADRGIYDAIGAGAADIFSPPKSLSDLLREIKRAGF